jgi:hypothetical protein
MEDHHMVRIILKISITAGTESIAPGKTDRRIR